jgi:hypothetical protein
MTFAPFTWLLMYPKPVLVMVREVPTSDRPPPLPEEPFELHAVRKVKR